MKKLKYLFLTLLFSLFLIGQAEAVTYYGTNATKRDNTIPPSKINANQQGGRLRVAYDDYTFTSTAFTGLDVLNLMKLPKGAKIYNVRASGPELSANASNCQFFIGVTANGSGVQLANTQLFTGSSGIECGAADFEFDMNSDQTIAGNSTVLAAETQVTLVTSQSTTHQTGGTVRVWVIYSVD